AAADEHAGSCGRDHALGLVLAVVEADLPEEARRVESRLRPAEEDRVAGGRKGGTHHDRVAGGTVESQTAHQALVLPERGRRAPEPSLLAAEKIDRRGPE